MPVRDVCTAPDDARPSVVLVPGIDFSGKAMTRFSPELSPRFRQFVVSVDPDGPDRSPPYPELCAAVAAKIRRDVLPTARGPICLLGESFGALVCLSLSRHLPEGSVRRAVLLNSAGALHRDEAGRARFAALRRADRGDYYRMALDLLGRHGRTVRRPDDVLSLMLSLTAACALPREAFQERYDRWLMPAVETDGSEFGAALAAGYWADGVLAVAGGRDALFDSAAEAMRLREFAGADALLLPEEGHVVSPKAFDIVAALS